MAIQSEPNSITITTADYSDSAIGALADAANRVSWPELANALYAELDARSRELALPVAAAPGTGEPVA